MTADFYWTPNEMIEFNKLLATIAEEVTIAYKDDTSLEEPTFICRADKWDDEVNYIYVSEPIDRYYYVEDVTFSKQMIYIRCSEDYLESHKEEILELSGIVERNAFLWNMYLTDTKLKTFNMSRIQTFPWEGGFLSNGNTGTKEASYVLTISGGGEDEEDEEDTPVPDGGGE